MRSAIPTMKTNAGGSSIRRHSSVAAKASLAKHRAASARTTAAVRHSPTTAPARKVQLLPEYLPARITLWLYQPNAKEVRLAGSFNNWDAGSTPMQHDGEGCWRVELILTRGRYEYRFVVDGNWADDPLASAYVTNPFGTLNCVLSVD